MTAQCNHITLQSPSSPTPAPSAGRRRIWAGPARASVPCQPKLSRAPRLPTTAPLSPCRPPCAPAAALQHPLLPAPHPVAEHQHQHQHHWKPHPAPSTYCPPAGRGEPPGHRPAAQPTAPTLRSPPHLAPAPVPKTPTPPRCLSFSYPGVNRQALHHLLTSATAPAAPPPTCTCWPAATAPYHLHQPPLAPL